MSVLLHIYAVVLLLAIFPLMFALAWDEGFGLKSFALAMLGACLWPLWPFAILGTWLWDRRTAR